MAAAAEQCVPGGGEGELMLKASWACHAKRVAAYYLLGKVRTSLWF